MKIGLTCSGETDIKLGVFHTVGWQYGTGGSNDVIAKSMGSQPELFDFEGEYACSPKKALTYISLFSSAGVGCYGFKEEDFSCMATVELLERRLKIQIFNHKCPYASGYICGDMSLQETKDKVFMEVERWRVCHGIPCPDVLIATPPCQGMSVANHKKKNELKRNSLVVESIIMVKQLRPRFFVFENVRAFLKSTCTDIDNQDKPIKEAIMGNLAGEYNILSKVVNFKDYGNPSSRTRTLVIGVRKDVSDVSPYELFPERRPERTLRELIGHLPALRTMGEISPQDIYHQFRRYPAAMEAWVSEIKEGQSAFDNTDPARIPHQVVDGRIVYNAKKNGDKYTRQRWDKVAPCVHTRNDIMASQNTVHPVDNRVFSIRELMLMMSVPASFRWSNVPFHELNALPLADKEKFLKREEMNIRQNLGEAVPTVIFRDIAARIKRVLARPKLTAVAMKTLVQANALSSTNALLQYVREHRDAPFALLSSLAEFANAQKEKNSAYYTRQDICFPLVANLPDASLYTELHILEPAIGVGNFLPSLIRKYEDVPAVHIDVVDIDENSLALLKELVARLHVPANIHIRYIHDDFLLHSFERHYDIVVGNPPYKKLPSNNGLLKQYRKLLGQTESNNVFSFFIEKAIRIADAVAFIVPKSLINAPEFNKTRARMAAARVLRLVDYGEKGFKGVKIETIGFILQTHKKPQQTLVESYITRELTSHPQSYLMDSRYPYWLIYRNADFDCVASRLCLGIFKSYRDRVITKKLTKASGRIRVLKSRNIGNNEIIDMEGYDCYMDDVSALDVAKFLNREGCVLVPNLSYYPRATFMPKNCITDGSVAILTPHPGETISESDLAFYATEEFSRFYATARNLGTRSLNIDNNSVYFFGKLKP